MKYVRVDRPSMQGFSLVEVLVALVILGVGLLGLARLQLGMLGGTAESVLYDSAIRLAEDKLELLRFDLVAGMNLQSGSDEITVYDVTMQRAWTWSVNDYGLAETTVTMRWREPRTGEENTISIPSKMTQPALAAQGWLIQSGAPTRETLP